jgi:hypothetical protein
MARLDQPATRLFLVQNSSKLTSPSLLASMFSWRLSSFWRSSAARQRRMHASVGMGW